MTWGLFYSAYFWNDLLALLIPGSLKGISQVAQDVDTGEKLYGSRTKCCSTKTIPSRCGRVVVRACIGEK
jgi:hypothetical protein